MHTRFILPLLLLFLVCTGVRAQSMCKTVDPPEPVYNPTALTVFESLTWPNGSRLTVSFFDSPSAQLKADVRCLAGEWERYANISFRWRADNDRSADIRIGFDQNDGHWSKIGTKSRNGKRTSMNMEVNDNTSATNLRRVVLHEFGHALGLKHEHQHPRAGICWDVAKVCAYFSGPPNNWSEERIRNNILKRLSTSDVSNHSGYDRLSIMHYSVSNDLTSCDYEVGWNTNLSPRDKSYIGLTYPDPNSLIGPLTSEYKWTAGWDNSETFTVMGNSYLLIVKSQGAGGDGKNLHLNEINADGTMGRKRQAMSIPSGVTSVQFLNMGNAAIISMLRKKRGGGKTLSMYQWDMNGRKIGRLLNEQTWTDGWSHSTHYRMNNKTYFIHYKISGTSSAGNNIVIREVLPTGKLGPATYDSKWTSGWDTWATYQVGSKHYLFIMKSSGYSGSGHNAIVHELSAAGKVGKRVGTYKWSTGWDTATPFVKDGKPYLYLMKSRDGDVHINDIMSNGAIGAVKFDNKASWTSGWTAARFFETNGRDQNLFLMKKGTGDIDVHSMGRKF